MPTSDERVRLCAARALGLSENLNDSLVLMESFDELGVVDVSIPGQSILISMSGSEFLARLEKALIQFDDDGSWIDLSRKDVEAHNGSIDIEHDGYMVYYRIANPDGSVPNSPSLRAGDRIVMFHTEIAHER